MAVIATTGSRIRCTRLGGQAWIPTNASNWSSAFGSWNSCAPKPRPEPSARRATRDELERAPRTQGNKQPTYMNKRRALAINWQTCTTSWVSPPKRATSEPTREPNNRRQKKSAHDSAAKPAERSGLSRAARIRSGQRRDADLPRAAFLGHAEDPRTAASDSTPAQVSPHAGATAGPRVGPPLARGPNNRPRTPPRPTKSAASSNPGPRPTMTLSGTRGRALRGSALTRWLLLRLPGGRNAPWF